MHLKMLSGKWRPFCLGLNVLSPIWQTDFKFCGMLWILCYIQPRVTHFSKWYFIFQFCSILYFSFTSTPPELPVHDNAQGICYMQHIPQWNGNKTGIIAPYHEIAPDYTQGWTGNLGTYRYMGGLGFWQPNRATFQYKEYLSRYRITIIKIRQSLYSLIFMVGIPNTYMGWHGILQ